MAAGDLLVGPNAIWKAKLVSPGAEPDFADPDYDDSAWGNVQLPVGNLSNGSADSCGVPRVASSWPQNTEYLFRRWVSARAVVVNFAVDNDLTVWWDGQNLGTWFNENCPVWGEWVPQSQLGRSSSSNLLAMRAADRGAGTYFTCEVFEAVGRSGFVIGKVAIGNGVGTA